VKLKGISHPANRDFHLATIRRNNLDWPGEQFTNSSWSVIIDSRVESEFRGLWGGTCSSEDEESAAETRGAVLRMRYTVNARHCRYSMKEGEQKT
jgi:hypothetical protein